jgi:hypothetical protein
MGRGDTARPTSPVTFLAKKRQNACVGFGSFWTLRDLLDFELWPA